jgi:hypothetical protein
MAAEYLHGPEVIILSDPQQPIKVLRASVIGLVATATDADATTFPLNTPVLVSSDKVIGKAGTTGTLANALTDIYKQARALVVVIRVPEGAEAAETQTNVIGAIGADESRTGIEALAYAEALTGVRPRLLIAPEFSHIPLVGAQLEAVAQKLRAIPIIDGSEGALAAVDTERGAYAKAIFVNPGIAYGEDKRKGSAAVAGHIVRVDEELGYWHSPSNKKMFGITGTSKPVDHILGSANSLSNLYSEKNICTIVRQDGGFYFWGNCLADGTLIPHERIRNIVADSILAAHQAYVDQLVTADYVDSVLSRVNNFLRALVKRGVIASGKVWFDEELNDNAALANKQVFFDYELALYTVAERMTFRQATRLATTGEIFDVAA